MTVSESAFIKLVPQSAIQTITIEELKDLFRYYRNITTKTGVQLDWDYSGHAFPYEIKETSDSAGKWFYLSSAEDRYHLIALAIDQETTRDGHIQTYIQVSLAGTSTYGDKSKANEFCRFLAKKVQGELHLFNKRIMYFYPRK
ncbi:MAG: DUF1885 family protein [Bacillus sp. (in: firmicutes)]